MNWKFILYDWYGLNVALFQVINAGTPATLGPLAWFFSLVGNYWTAPLTLLGLGWWSKSATNSARADAVWHRLIVFGTAFLLALLAATVLKLWLDFPRPPAVFGELVRIGEHERHYSLPSGHATYSALVIGALWPLMGRRGRVGLVLYGVLSRNRRKFRQPINVACPAPGRWGRPNSRVTSRHFDHGNASRTSRPDCSGLDEAD